jgi:hypothetical protein
MTRNDLVNDIAVRIGNPNMLAPYTEPVIARALQRVYTRLNLVHKPIVKTITILNTDITDNKYPRPSDFIIVSKTDPFFEYVEYEKFDESVTTQRMMADDKRSDGSLYFSPESTWGGVTEITMDYYQNHILDSPSSEPLWPIELHDLLLYATCRELSTKYEHYDEDAMTVKDLSTRLNLLHKYGHHNHQIDKANSDLSPKKTDYGQPWRG